MTERKKERKNNIQTPNGRKNAKIVKLNSFAVRDRMKATLHNKHTENFNETIKQNKKHFQLYGI